MDCSPVQSQIINYLLGDLDGTTQAAIKEHLSQCPVCAQEVSELKLADHYLHKSLGQLLNTPSLSAGFAAQAYGKLHSGQEKSRRHLIYYKTVATAAVILIGLISYFSLATSHGQVLEGTLYVEREGKKGMITNKGLLPMGQTVKTLSDQSAKIKLRDGSVLEMMPDTILTLNDDRLLNLEEGELDCQVAKGGGFTISMAGAELKTLGTGFNIRMSTNRKEIITSQGNPLSFITSATVKVAVVSGRVLLTTEQKDKRLHQEVGTGETVIREIDPSLPVELQTEIKDLIRQLGNENKAIREKAFDAMIKIGYVILPFLQKISLPDNSPIKVQINRLLARFPRTEIFWCHEIPQVSFALQTPVVSGDQLYIVSESGLYAMDCLTGEVNWKFRQEGFNSAPVVFEGSVYIGTLNGGCLAIKSATGKIIWQQNGLGGIQSTPTLFNETLYVGSGEPGTNRGKFYALDIRTGKIKWTFFAHGIILYSQAAIFSRRSGPANGIPNFSENESLALFGDWDNRLYCLNIQTGELVWDYQTKGQVVTSPVVADDLVYCGSWDGQLYALSVYDGEKAWSFQADSAIIESPVKRGKIIYWGTQHKIYAFDLERRTVMWTYNRERYAPGTILVKEEKIYLGTDGGKLIVLDAATGEKECDFEMSFGDVSYKVTGPPAIFNNILYVTSHSAGGSGKEDRVYALKLK